MLALAFTISGEQLRPTQHEQWQFTIEIPPKLKLYGRKMRRKCFNCVLLPLNVKANTQPMRRQQSITLFPVCLACTIRLLSSAEIIVLCIFVYSCVHFSMPSFLPRKPKLLCAGRDQQMFHFTQTNVAVHALWRGWKAQTVLTSVVGRKVLQMQKKSTMYTRESANKSQQ